jgi:hypothetical protein
LNADRAPQLNASASLIPMLLLDIGLPMIAVYWPPAWLAFVPVVLIEAFVGLRILRLGFTRIVVASAVTNLFSTLLGIPLTWFALALIELLAFGSARGFESPLQKLYAVTVQSPWLMPYSEQSPWIVPVAAAVLSIPMYVMSALSEYIIARFFFRSVPRKKVFRWQLVGNACSYVFLIGLFVVVFYFGDYFQWLYKPFQGIMEFFVELIFRIATLGRGAP